MVMLGSIAKRKCCYDFFLFISLYMRLNLTKSSLKEYPPTVSAWDPTRQHFPLHNHPPESGMHQQSPFLYPVLQMAPFARDWKTHKKKEVRCE